MMKFEPGLGMSTDPESQTDTSSRVSRMPRKRRSGVYDRWLMTRFTIAFIFLA
jgi:hypothetical protein